MCGAQIAVLRYQTVVSEYVCKLFVQIMYISLFIWSSDLSFRLVCVIQVAMCYSWCYVYFRYRDFHRTGI